MAANDTANQDTPLLPPEESLWQKYSPHFELPLAGMTSIFLHGLIVGMLAVGAIAFLFASNLEATKPPKMDVVMIEGDGGGFDGLGGAPGLPGSPDAGAVKRTEFTPMTEQPEPIDKASPPRLLKDPVIDLGLPLIDDGKTPMSAELSIELAKLAKEADEQVKKAMKIPTQAASDGKPKLPGVKGSGNPKGQGGLGGSGGGIGKGNRKGPGKGIGDYSGRKATKQEIYAQRWHFDLTGDPKEHARKLAAIGFTVAFPDPRGGFVIVTDLNRRPVETRRDNLMGFQEAVKWYNTTPASIQSLSRELQLPFAPRFVVLLLPKDREDAMAQAEKQYADRQGRAMNTITMTRFDFRLRNGAYDPMVIHQK